MNSIDTETNAQIYEEKNENEASNINKEEDKEENKDGNKEEISLTEEQSNLKTQLLKNSAFMNLFKKKDNAVEEEDFIQDSKKNAICSLFEEKITPI